MFKFILIGLSLCLSYSDLIAQSSSDRSVVSSSGGQGTIGSGVNLIDINFTIGETVIDTYIAGNSIISLGFQQPPFDCSVLPQITNLPRALCVGSAPITLTGTPAGGIFTVDQSLIPITQLNPGVLGVGLYTVNYSYVSPDQCTVVGSQLVKITKDLPPILNLAASNSLDNTHCSAQLSALATGMSFVFTGPGGYVFSNIYRQDGVYDVFAKGAKIPGIYTLTAYGEGGCQTSKTIQVTGTKCD